MQKILVIGLCGLCIQPASAVYFDSIIYDMDASKDFISRPLVNDTKSSITVGLKMTLSAIIG